MCLQASNAAAPSLPTAAVPVAVEPQQQPLTPAEPSHVYEANAAAAAFSAVPTAPSAVAVHASTSASAATVAPAALSPSPAAASPAAPAIVLSSPVSAASPTPAASSTPAASPAAPAVAEAASPSASAVRLPSLYLVLFCVRFVVPGKILCERTHNMSACVVEGQAGSSEARCRW